MDDWEDAADDFVYQAPVQSAVKTIWDDEEEEVVVAKVGPSAAQVEAAAKKTKEEEIRMSNVLKFAILEDETPEEKKARERKQIEDADAELAGELFGGGKVSGTTAKAGASFSTGIAAATVKTKADHTNFGILCAKKLGDSNSFNIGAFYKTLTEKLQKNLTLETCDEMLALLTKVRREEKKTNARCDSYWVLLQKNLV